MEGYVWPVSYDFYYLSCGLDQKKLLMTYLEGVSLHVRPICACCVLYIKKQM